MPDGITRLQKYYCFITQLLHCFFQIEKKTWSGSSVKLLQELNSIRLYKMFDVIITCVKALSNKTQTERFFELAYSFRTLTFLARISWICSTLLYNEEYERLNSAQISIITSINNVIIFVISYYFLCYSKYTNSMV